MGVLRSLQCCKISYLKLKTTACDGSLAQPDPLPNASLLGSEAFGKGSGCARLLCDGGCDDINLPGGRSPYPGALVGVTESY